MLAHSEIERLLEINPVSVPARAEHHRERGQNPIQFLQMATEAKSERRLTPESPRRSDPGDKEGYLFAREYSLQYLGSGACRRYVSTGS